MYVCVALLAAWLTGGIEPYTERGHADFDVVYQELAGQGEWIRTGEYLYVFKPNAAKDPQWAPYRSGQWVYTDFGWTWHSDEPGGWALYHYGTWVRQAGHGWVWRPQENWLPATVEWRLSGNFIGWRPSQMNRFGELTEPEEQRYKNPSEWTFIPRNKFDGPLKPSDAVSAEEAAKLLEDSTFCDHRFVGYREIDRPGPEFIPSESRTVRTLRSLPSPGTQPSRVMPGDFFLYRPRFHQDADGMGRRVDILLKRATQPAGTNSPPAEVRDLMGIGRTNTPVPPKKK
jgi:hypothetical protein